jgi:hypothetical protein
MVVQSKPGLSKIRRIVMWIEAVSATVFGGLALWGVFLFFWEGSQAPHGGVWSLVAAFLFSILAAAYAVGAISLRRQSLLGWKLFPGLCTVWILWDIIGGCLATC